MKKFFQILGICSILVFSFYYTDKIALIVQEKNPVLKEIRAKGKDLQVNSVDATVMNEYIIPGLSGSKVNIEKSFLNMKSLNEYNEYYLVYDKITPKVSLQDNKDKIIISGNKKNNKVSLVLEYNEEIMKLLSAYKVDLLINKDNYINNTSFELINNETSSKLYKQVNTLLEKDKLNKNICLLNDYNKKICLEDENYLIKPSLILNASSIIEVKNALENGSIILIDKQAKIEDIKILLKQIKFQDLDIVYLSELIKE